MPDNYDDERKSFARMAAEEYDRRAREFMNAQRGGRLPPGPAREAADMYAFESRQYGADSPPAYRHSLAAQLYANRAPASEYYKYMASGKQSPVTEDDAYAMRNALERPGEYSDPEMFTVPRPGQYIPFRDYEMYPGQTYHTGRGFETEMTAPLEPEAGGKSLTGVESKRKPGIVTAATGKKK